jgi:hypothetical protein
MYKKDLDLMEQSKHECERKIKDLMTQIHTRDQEIHRLSMMYQGGQNFETVKFNYDKTSSEELINKLQKQNEFLNFEN